MDNPTGATAEKLVTGEDLFAMGDIGPCELIDGRIVPMSPTGVEHGAIEALLAGQLRAFARQRKVGRVLSGEVGVYIHRNPDRVRGPRVSPQRCLPDPGNRR